MDNENRSGEFILDNTKVEASPEPDRKPEITPPLQTFPNNVHFYSSYSENPQGIEFEGEEENERILLLIRSAMITNLPWILAAILLLILPPILLPFAPFIGQLTLSASVQGIIIAFYYLMVGGFILVEFSLWYFNAAFVTNTRLVDADVEGILYKNVSETKLDLIQDVSYTQIGAIRNLFNYGDIFVQTAGSMANFEVLKAPKPAQIVRLIQSLIGDKKDDAS